ncbi:MAG: nucleoside kinase [Clostridia bacterium]|nr:nucleoside kinase [Clostridia bacterium]
MLNITNSYRRYSLTADKINQYALSDPAEFVRVSEKAFRSDIHDIAESIVSDDTRCKVIMLAGPSASGKTTTAKILQEELKSIGCGSEIISMDNFYLGEKNVPRTAEGKPDFETVRALNIEELEKCISDLLKYGQCDILNFDFATSSSLEERTHIDLHNDSIAIIEGIHALNPIFTQHIVSTVGLKKIYISVKQGIRESGRAGYLVTAAELRLFRRLVRDCKFRGSNADHTMGMWKNVLFGEKNYIVPFKYTGDITINSIHMYEPCVIAYEAIEYLEKVSQDSSEYEYAQDLIQRARHFVPISEVLVPDNSLLREFLGKSKFDF